MRRVRSKAIAEIAVRVARKRGTPYAFKAIYRRMKKAYANGTFTMRQMEQMA
jgi:hypothetical protein